MPRRIWTIIEPVALLLLLGLAARWIIGAVGLSSAITTDALLHSVPPDWARAAGAELGRNAIKWGLLLAAAWAICRMRGFSIARPAFASKSDLSLTEKAGLGLAIAIPLTWLSVLPRWIHFHVLPLGEVPVVWDLIYPATWSADFWLFAAVTSFVVPPLVEELFFRGYLLGSLLRTFSEKAAIVLSTLIFTGVHFQYLAPDPFALYNAAMLLVSGLALAVLVVRTGSLIPALAAHSYANVPQPLEWAPVQTVPAVLLAIWLWHRFGQIRPDAG